jgi:hypothetical protein
MGDEGLETGRQTQDKSGEKILRVCKSDTDSGLMCELETGTVSKPGNIPFHLILIVVKQPLPSKQTVFSYT